MANKTAIEVKNLGVRFRMQKEKTDTLKEFFVKTLKKEIKYNEFWALKDVSFSVEKGLESWDLTEQEKVRFLRPLQAY